MIQLHHVGVALVAAMIFFAVVFVALTPPPSTPKQERAKQEQVAKKKRKRDDGPGICVGACIGPHIDLGTGELRVGPSLGPGLEF